jgi:histidine triad (HIT) family protein
MEHPCVFCEIVDGRAPASIVHEDERTIAFMSIQPSQQGECMVVPKQHIDHFTDIPDDFAAHIMTIAQKIGRRMRVVFAPRRVGMVVHGFGVPHAHLLLIPQHNTDDITSARFARIEGEKIVFDLNQIPFANRNELDRQAKELSI